MHDFTLLKYQFLMVLLFLCSAIKQKKKNFLMYSLLLLKTNHKSRSSWESEAHICSSINPFLFKWNCHTICHRLHGYSHEYLFITVHPKRLSQNYFLTITIVILKKMENIIKYIAINYYTVWQNSKIRPLRTNLSFQRWWFM